MMMLCERTSHFSFEPLSEKLSAPSVRSGAVEVVFDIGEGTGREPLHILLGGLYRQVEKTERRSFYEVAVKWL